jgi:transposase-like protein
MAKRSDGKEQFWRNIVASFEPGRETIRGFCKRLGIGEQAFYWWRRQLRHREQAPTSAGIFVPVRITPTASKGVPIEVRLPGARILRLRPGFDPESLRQLLDVLDTTPPSRQSSC